MKNLLFILLFFLFAAFCHSQTLTLQIGYCSVESDLEGFYFEKNVTARDSLNQMAYRTEFERDYISDPWELWDSTHYEYDNLNNVTENAHYWRMSNQLIGDYKYIYQYNNNELINFKKYDWQTGVGWVLSIEVFFAYYHSTLVDSTYTIDNGDTLVQIIVEDTSLNTITTTNANLIGGNYNYSTRKIVYNNSNNYDTLTISQIWNTQWVNSYSISIARDQAYRPVLVTEKLWEITSSSWRNNYQYYYNYYSGLDKDTSIQYSWNSNLSLWQYARGYYSQYDPFGKVLLNLDTIPGGIFYRHEYVYNISGILLEYHATSNTFSQGHTYYYYNSQNELIYTSSESCTANYNCTTRECYGWDSIATNDILILLPDTINICNNDIAHVSINFIHAPAFVNINWTPVANITGDTTDNPLFFPQLTTYYYVAVSDNNGNFTTDSIYIVVNSLPNSPIIDTIGPTDYCSNDTSTTLFLNLTTGLLVNWFENGTQVSWSDSLNITHPGSSEYFAVITDSNGCMATSDTVIVNNRLSPQGYIYPVPYYYCAGDTISLDYSGNNYAKTFQWTKNNMLISGANDSSLFNPSSDTFTLIITDTSNQCISETNFYVVIYDSLPNAQTQATDSVLCIGDSAIILNAVVYDSLNFYIWNFGLNHIVNDTLYINSQYSSSNWVLTVMRGRCQAHSDTINLLVDHTHLPFLNFSDTIFICSNDSVNLIANNNQNFFTYLWSTGETSSSIIVNSTDEYSVQTTSNQFGCIYYSDTVTVLANIASPSPTITYSSGDLITNVNYGIQWYHDTVPITGANQNIYHPSSPGVYFVYYTDSGGCTSISLPYYHLINSVNILNKDKFFLYPNPANKFLFVSSFTENLEEIMMINELGEIVYLSKNSITKDIDVSNFPTGIYLYRITAGEKVYTGKIVIEKQ